jgi:hypothetical protein
MHWNVLFMFKALGPVLPVGYFSDFLQKVPDFLNFPATEIIFPHNLYDMFFNAFEDHIVSPAIATYINRQGRMKSDSLEVGNCSVLALE